ncbi:MAG TPA: hypothetical protein VK557_05820 [Pyrinomonadaceae bacterium]|nr:hypothetical protein [Pyrinomonadaceae bacterium]
MKRPLSLVLVHLFVITTIQAQSPAATTGAANSVQVSQPSAATAPTSPTRDLKIPAGSAVEIEASYTISSYDLHPNDLISFRVIVPIKIDGVTVIEKNSLVTGRVVQAKRGGHWGKAGKLSWTMQDVVAVDLARVPLQANIEGPDAKNGVKGTSHGGQVATEMIVFGSLMFIAAPLVLMSGFRRGENAVLPEGRRFVVYVQRDTIVKMPLASANSQTVAP